MESPRKLKRTKVENSAYTYGAKYIDDNGFLVNRNVRIARAGAYVYKGREFDLMGEDADKDIKVFRDISCYTPEILEKFGNIVVTNDHPNEMVNPGNVSSCSIGNVGDKVFIDGEDIIAEKIFVRNQDAIEEVEKKGKKQLSIGFEAEYTLGKIDIDGEEYDGTEVITSINHISLVTAGKAGPAYRMNHKQEESVMTMCKVEVAGEFVEMPEESAVKLRLLMKNVKAPEATSAENLLETLSTGFKEMLNELKDIKTSLNTVETPVVKPVENEADKEKDTENEDDKDKDMENEDDTDEDKKESSNMKKNAVNSFGKDLFESKIMFNSDTAKTADATSRSAIEAREALYK